MTSARCQVIVGGVRRLALALAALALAGGCGKDGDVVPASKPKVSENATTSYPVRHVLIEVRGETEDKSRPPRTKAEALAKAKDVAQRLRAPGADFAAIAKAESDDRVSGGDGGFGVFLEPWHGHDPVLVAAAKALKVGEVSEPVLVERGYELLQLLSREDGKAEEAKALIPVEGVMVPWTGLADAGITARTKDEAYADAAKVVNGLRAGMTIEDVMSGLGEARRFRVVVRRGMQGAGELAEAAATAKVDEWLDPVETSDGYAIGKRIAYQRAIVRHIVVTHVQSSKPVPKSKREPEAAEALAAEAFKRVSANPESWDQIVREISDEPSSKELGGFMGEVTTTADGRLRVSPEIEEIVLAMKPGTREGPVATRYGYHVFWRVD